MECVIWTVTLLDRIFRDGVLLDDTRHGGNRCLALLDIWGKSTQQDRIPGMGLCLRNSKETTWVELGKCVGVCGRR